MNLYAKPISDTAKGFHFSKLSEFIFASTTCRNKAGELVKKFAIEFVEGSEIDRLLAKLWPLKSTTLKTYLDAVETWSEDDKVKYIIAVGELGYERAEYVDGRDAIDIELFKFATMKRFAEHMMKNGIYATFPKDKVKLETVIEELEADYSEINIGGVNYIFLAE